MANFQSSASISQNPAYDKVQSELGDPIGQLQVQDEMDQLRDAVNIHREFVLSLLRRLEPVSRIRSEAGSTKSQEAVQPKDIAPLAQSISMMTDDIDNLSNNVKNAIKALQV